MYEDVHPGKAASGLLTINDHGHAESLNSNMHCCDTAFILSGTMQALRADLERAQHATIAAAAPSHAPLEQLALLQAQYEQAGSPLQCVSCLQDWSSACWNAVLKHGQHAGQYAPLKAFISQGTLHAAVTSCCQLRS